MYGIHIEIIAANFPQKLSIFQNLKASSLYTKIYFTKLYKGCMYIYIYMTEFNSLTNTLLMTN